MANFGRLAAEICWRVWGTPGNFNEFQVLAALVHGTLVVAVSGVEQRAPPIFDRAAIALGIGPYSSFILFLFYFNFFLLFFKSFCHSLHLQSQLIHMQIQFS